VTRSAENGNHSRARTVSSESRFQLDDDGVKPALADVLGAVSDGIPPADLAGLELDVVAPAIGSGDAQGPAAQHVDDECGVIVHGFPVARLADVLEDADVVVLESDLHDLRRHRGRVLGSRSHRRSPLRARVTDG
jgi:hypothetical protein